MSKFTNQVAVVTGAASGIGRALVYQLATEGARLAISDVNETGLEETRAHAVSLGAEVDSSRLDVADRDAVFAHADAVVSRFGEVNLVINNAGVTVAGSFEDTSVEDFEWLMGINFWGPYFGSKAFLPYLKQASWGHIVNVSSVFGIIGVPRQSAYNASKFAVRGFTESLRQELDASDSNVSCTSVHPGGIKTNIARAARTVGPNSFGKGMTPEEAADEFDKITLTTAESAAKTILKAVTRNKKRVLVGPDAHAIDLIQRVFPVGYQWLVSKSPVRN